MFLSPLVKRLNAIAAKAIKISSWNIAVPQFTKFHFLNTSMDQRAKSFQIQNADHWSTDYQNMSQ